MLVKAVNYLVQTLLVQNIILVNVVDGLSGATSEPSNHFATLLPRRNIR